MPGVEVDIIESGMEPGEESKVGTTFTPALTELDGIHQRGDKRYSDGAYSTRHVEFGFAGVKRLKSTDLYGCIYECTRAALVYISAGLFFIFGSPGPLLWPQTSGIRPAKRRSCKE